MSKEFIVLEDVGELPSYEKATEEILNAITVKFLEKEASVIWSRCFNFCAIMYREVLSVKITDGQIQNLLLVALERSENVKEISKALTKGGNKQ